MSLVIYVSKKSVLIPRYQLELPFHPPSMGLTDAAIGAFKLLRQSVSMQIMSSEEEKNEVLSLLRHYGIAIYNAIIPASIRQELSETEGLYLFPHDTESRLIPWELLHDGHSFLSLTRGVIRINQSEFNQPFFEENRSVEPLKIALNSYTPLLTRIMEKGVNQEKNFISYIEELVDNNLVKQSNIEFSVNSNSGYKSVIQSLNNTPNLFLFSGYVDQGEWILDSNDSENQKQSWFHHQLQPSLSKAVQQGLKVLILQTSDLLEDWNQQQTEIAKRYFNFGVPCVITVNGRIARYRFKKYFHYLTAALAQGMEVIAAHYLGLNELYKSEPLSWDWSWIQLHLNEKLFSSSQKVSISFRLPQDHSRKEKKENRIKEEQSYKKAHLGYHRFAGNYRALQQITEELDYLYSHEILCLKANSGQMLEEYLQEYFRRLGSSKPFNLSILYYQRWGFQGNLGEQLPTAPLSGQFSFLLEYSGIRDYFEQSLIRLKEENLNAHHYLIVYTPPKKLDSFLDRWLQKKQKLGWKIIFLQTGKVATQLQTKSVIVDRVDSLELVRAFEDEMPIQWKSQLEPSIASPMENFSLLRIAQKLGDEALINAFLKKRPPKEYWQQVFDLVFSKLSINSTKIFYILYLFRVKVTPKYLRRFLQLDTLEKELFELRNLFLIDTDLFETLCWMPTALINSIHQFNLLPDQKVLSYGQEILQRSVALLDEKKLPPKDVIFGFQYCIQEVTRLGSPKTGLLRNLQFGKKLSNFPQSYDAIFLQIVRNSLELSLLIDEKSEIKKTIMSCMRILENLSLERKTIELYEWLLNHEDRNRNWYVVAEIQMNLAMLHAKINETETAIGLLTSAFQLSNDIKNYAHRYQNLITIALLLLDLGAIEKVRKLVENSQFDLSRLNKENLAKLWLIDAHLLFSEKRYNDALQSFLTSSQQHNFSVSDRLLGRTYESLAVIYQYRNQENYSLNCLAQAAELYEQAGELEATQKILSELITRHTKAEHFEETIQFLEWSYKLLRESDDAEQLGEIADQLGHLYYKVGNKVKSTEYYKIAQSLTQT